MKYGILNKLIIVTMAAGGLIFLEVESGFVTASQTKHARADKDEREVRDLMEKYLELFNAAAAKEIAQHIYAAPIQHTSKTGHGAVTSTAEVQNMFDNIFKQIKARGWVRSHTHSLDVLVLGDGLALVELNYSRIAGDGKPIPPDRRAGLYVVKKIDDAWRIVALYGHDATKKLQLATEKL